MNRKVTFSFALAVMCLYITFAQQISIPDENTVKALMKKYHVPTVGIGIIEEGEIQSANVYGTMDDNSEASIHTLFNIASLTKPLVTQLTLQLVSNGVWNLDSPLYPYWVDPDVVSSPYHKKLTTRIVLDHTTGLPNWRGHEPEGKLTFAFEPGTQWKYSGEGFEYLREALEHKFKQPIEQLADSLLFEPLQMNDTRFYWDENMNSKLYANRHKEDGAPYPLETWNAANASNLVLTTITDYCRFAIGVLHSFGLKSDIAEEMVKPQYRFENKNEFGLGWLLIKDLDNDEYAQIHTGSNPGIHTIIILFPKSESGIVIFTNGDNGSALYKELITSSSILGKEVVERM
ncbi:serine hydrolase domain-containing protein [Flagellimonas iocasae]|uniref:Serine hydrolase domain-containing protein n=1 Tax=Flagellimonas iocasae TaxID=2055905 RepID=A0ABW4XVG1_9FLAO